MKKSAVTRYLGVAKKQKIQAWEGHLGFWFGIFIIIVKATARTERPDEAILKVLL